MSPEAIEDDIALRKSCVAHQKPQAENRLSQDVEDRVGDDFTVNTEEAPAASDGPDTAFFD